MTISPAISGSTSHAVPSIVTRASTPTCDSGSPGEPTVLFPSCTYLSRRPGDICQPVLEREVFRCGVAAHCNDSDSSRAIRWPAAPSRFMEMEGFMCLFNGPERTLYFTFGPCRCPGAILTCRCMRQPVNFQGLHHILKYMALALLQS